MNSKLKIAVLIVGWMLITAVLLLAPSPRGLGELGRRFSISYDEVKAVLQPAVHFFMMAVGTFLLMHWFAKKKLFVAITASVVVALILALALEFSQSMLPKEFSRACDMHDLIPSLGGAIGGVIAALPFRRRAASQSASCS